MSEKGKPITPREARAAARDSIPLEVFEAFNELLAEHGANAPITIRQEEVVDRIIEKMNRGVAVKVTRAMIFDRHWLDIEDTYRDAGWSVEYDKPAYCEDYEAYWTFKPKRNK